MLTVKTLRASFRPGDCGLYALEDIARGQTVWRYTPTVDRAIPLATRAAMTSWMQALVDSFTAPLGGEEDGFADGARPALCHSATPNICFGEAELGVALRDIAAGEELTADHAQFGAARACA